jgi:hypothetical protein
MMPGLLRIRARAGRGAGGLVSGRRPRAEDRPAAHGEWCFRLPASVSQPEHQTPGTDEPRESPAHKLALACDPKRARGDDRLGAGAGGVSYLSGSSRTEMFPAQS